MPNQERAKTVPLTVIGTLAVALIAIVNARTLFPVLMFYGIVITLIVVIVLLTGYILLGERISRYVGSKIRERKQNILSKKYFEDFKDFVKEFCNLPEFKSPTLGIIRILNDIPPGKNREKEEEVNFLINRLTIKFASILRDPVCGADSSFKQELLFGLSKSQINRQVLSQYVREFENFIQLHKSLYVDESVTIARKIGI